MTEQEYLSRLERALKDAPEDDRNEALAFYHGYFEDGGIPTDSPEEAADRLLHDGKPTVPGKKNNVRLEVNRDHSDLSVLDWHSGGMVRPARHRLGRAGSVPNCLSSRQHWFADWRHRLLFHLLSHRITGNWLGTRWRWFNHALLEALPARHHWTLERTQIIVAEIPPLDEEGGCL